MISIKTGLAYFDKLVRPDDNCESLRLAVTSLRDAHAEAPVNGLDFYGAMLPIVEVGNLDSMRNGDGRKLLVQAYDEQAGSKYRVNEITTALAAGFLLSTETHELSTLNLHSILDVESGLMFINAIRVVLDKQERRRQVESQPFMAPMDLIVQDNTYEAAKVAMRSTPRNDKHRPLTAAARFHLAAQTVDAEFAEGCAFMVEKMEAARKEMADDLAANDETEDAELMGLYGLDLLEWQMVLTSAIFSYYTLYAQAADVEEQGYDAAAWRNTMFNIYEGGVIEAIFDDLLHLIVEQPEDAVARCHNIVSRARSIQAGLNELFEIYDKMANAHKVEALH